MADSGSDNKIVIELDLDAGQFTTNIKGAEASVKKFSEQSKEGFSNAGAKVVTLNSAVELLAHGYEAVNHAVEMVTDKLKEAVAVAAKEEQGIHQLNLAMSNAGQYSKEASDHLLEYAENLQKTTSYSADAVVETEALARGYAKTNEQTLHLTKAAVELSSATGTSLEGAVRRLGMSLKGQGAHMATLIPGIGKLTEAQLKHGAAIDIVMKRYGGSSSQTLMTFEGRMKNLHNAYEQQYSAIGKLITQSPIINKVMEVMGERARKVAEEITKWGKSGGFENFLKSLLDIAKVLTTYVVPTLELVYNLGKGVFQSIALGGQVILSVVSQFVASALSTVESGVRGMSKLVGFFSDSAKDTLEGAANSIRDNYSQGAQDFADTIHQTTADMAGKTADTWSNAFDFSFTASLDQRVDELQKFANQAESTGKHYKNNIHGMAGETEKVTVEIGKHIIQLTTKVMAQGLSTLGASLVKGKDAFKDFGKVILGIIGDMSIAIGTNIMMQGLAIGALATALATLNPAAAIAAGAALIVLGGALKAMSEGEGMGGAPGGAGGGGGFGGGGEGSPGMASQAQMMQKHAQIIVNGDFLNSRETANHLAEVIRQNSDITDYAIVAQGRQYA